MRRGKGEKCGNIGSYALPGPGNISSLLIILICQTRPVIVRKLVIPELPMADSRGIDPSCFV